MGTHPQTARPVGPFVGYRVMLATGADRQHLAHLAAARPVLQPLLAGGRGIVVTTSGAAMLYDAAEAVVRELGLPFPIRFSPVRCARGRALPFEAVALSAPEILHLVHEGFFRATRGREAAIAAVDACGASPVPALGLQSFRRGSGHAAAERHVDALIEGEPRLGVPAEADLSRWTA